MPEASIVIALHDPGGTAAVTPLISALSRQYDCTVYAHPNALRELTGIAHTMADTNDPAAIEAIIEKEQPDLVLVTTSSPPDSIDKLMTAAAVKQDIPALAVVDYWSGYRRRFEEESGRLAFLPDIIAVMDDTAKTEAVKEGLPAERIVVTGSPRFEALAHKAFDREKIREDMAAQYGLDPDRQWLLYLSQPHGLSGEDPQQARDAFGYNEFDIARTLENTSAVLLARFHPKERAEGREALAGIPHTAVNDGDVNALIAAADLVAGTSTVALIDAYIQGTPVISIQPGLKGPDWCPLSRNGMIPLCQTADDVKAALASPPQPGAHKILTDNVTDNIRAQIERLLERKRKTA